MSKERKFHELIEQQNREEKDAVWAKLQQKERERLQQSAPAPTVSKPRSFSWRKWAPIFASSFAVLLVGVFAVWQFFPFDKEPNEDRYFTSQSYETVTTQQTIKEYAQEFGKDLLYFDWYEETDYLESQIWQVKDTQEIICFQEEIIDINTGCQVEMYVMESNIEIENFLSDEETDRTSEVKEIQVDWRYSKFRAYASFEYENYNYYLRVDDPLDENYILDLVELLLS